MSRRLQLTAGLALAIGAGLAVPSPAAAATERTVCDSGCDFTTLADAVAAAQDGDTIVVGTDWYLVDGTITVTQDDLTIRSYLARFSQTVDAPTFVLTGAGITLEGLWVTSEAPTSTELIRIEGDDASIVDSVVYGPEQPSPRSGWSTTRGVVSAPAVSGLTISGTRFRSLTEGVRLGPGSTAAITDNEVVDNVHDFVIDDADASFSGNHWVESFGALSDWSVVILPGTRPELYPDIDAVARANSYLPIWDQRDDEQHLHRRLEVCADGCDFTTIQDAVAAAHIGERIHIESGSYSIDEPIVVDKEGLAISGPFGVTVIQSSDAPAFVLAADGIFLGYLEVTSDDLAPIDLIRVEGDGAGIFRTTVVGPAQTGPPATWVENRGIVAAPGATGLSLYQNRINDLRTGVHLGPGVTGAIDSTTVSHNRVDVKIDDADVDLGHLHIESASSTSLWGIVIGGRTDPSLYPSVEELARLSHYANTRDQRDGEIYKTMSCAIGRMATREDIPTEAQIRCTGGRTPYTYAEVTGPGLDIDSSGLVTYEPDPDWYGTGPIELNVHDAIGQGVRIDTEHSATPVNDPPFFWNEPFEPWAHSSRPQVFDWAYNIHAAWPLNERLEGQTVHFELTPVASSGSLEFARGPILEPDGRLVFQAERRTWGTATFSVVAVDDGRRALPHVNRSEPHALTIHVTK